MESFCDLNIMFPLPGKEEEYYNMCSALGYRTIAFNHVADISKDKSRDRIKLEFPFKNLKTTDKLRVLKRVTLVCAEQNQISCLKRPEFGNVDIIAITPTTEEVFNQCLKNPQNINLITFDLTKPLPFRVKHSHMGALRNAKILTEVSYVAAIRDSGSCKHIVSNTKDINWTSRNRGIVLSSGADDPLFVRGPYDVMNLATVFGMPHKTARAALSTNCTQLFIRSISRTQTFNGILQKCAANSEQLEQWQLPEKLHLSEYPSGGNKKFKASGS